MFALVNLMAQGRQMRVWLAGSDAVAGMVAVTEDGMLLVQWPGGDWPAATRALSGIAVTGMLGPADQVAALRALLRLDGARHESSEPGFWLRLDALRMPECGGLVLSPIAQDAAATVRLWRAAYEQELFAMPPDEAREKAAQDVARWLAADSHRVLMQDGALVALTGFNAILPDVVQVGAVYVPPHLRGRGHARAAVGLHLEQARADGVDRAVLFAASDAAERAYRALGFQPAGTMGIVLFDAPRTVA